VRLFNLRLFNSRLFYVRLFNLRLFNLWLFNLRLFYVWLFNLRLFTHVLVYLNSRYSSFISFYIMDFSRCVVVNVSEYVWERILPYMMKKSDKYYWIATAKNEPYKPNSDIIHKHVTLHIWWDGGKHLSATPLRSRIKRVKQRVDKSDTMAEDVKECSLAFKLSRSRQTKHILNDLVVSIEKHSVGHSNVTFVSVSRNYGCVPPPFCCSYCISFSSGTKTIRLIPDQ
jgi:hypothetical protein